ECRAAPRRAVDVDVPVALTDDAVDRRKAEPRAHAYGLGGEEGLEDVRLGLGVHALARVRNDERHVGARPNAAESLAVARRDVDRLDADAEAPAPGHRVARVDSEVQEHLLELTRVRADVARGVGDAHRDSDMLADDAAEHPVHVADDRTNLDD